MVIYDNHLISTIERTLRDALHDPAITLNRRSDRKMGPFHITIQDSYSGHIKYYDGRYVTQLVLPGVSVGSFYLGCVLLFGVSQAGDDEHAHVLQHSSLNLIQNYPTGDIHSVVRAEWDGTVISTIDADHAQPHWHFSQKPREVESAVRTITGQEMEFGTALIFDDLPPLSDIHFAMVSLCDAESKPAYKEDFRDSKHFISWFRELLHYLLKQLIFISGTTVSQVVEFGV